MVYRGAIHFHSTHSYDSRVRPDRILDFAVRNNLNFLILTDHNTISGSQELQALAHARGLEIEIPIAAEYETDCGDVIAAFIDKEIEERNFEALVARVREMDGVLFLPHPFTGHERVEALAQAVDLVETFNGRSLDSRNRRAEQLAENLGKKTYAASDAHVLRDLENCILEFEQKGNLKNSILTSPIIAKVKQKNLKIDVALSQLIKGVKKRNMNIIMMNVFRVFKYMICLEVNKRC